MAEAPGAFERDLREIRQARGVSLSEVQQETRIPADVLDRFEAGHLVGDSNYNEVYLRNLLKAYASAIGLPPAAVLKAYDAAKSNAYGGELQRHLDSVEAPEPSSTPEKPTPPKAAPPKKAATTTRIESPPAKESPPPKAAPPAVAALREQERPAAPTSPPPPRTETKARVQSRESVTSSTSAIESSWGLIIAGTLAAMIVIGGVLWLMLRPDSPDVEPTEQVTVAQDDENETNDDAEDPDAPPVGDAPRLDIPIQVTVIAQDGALGGANGFRVTEAPDTRRPYWIEQGEQQTFSSETEVIVWGTGTGDDFGIPSEARLRLQGFTWQPREGAVLRIDQQRGQALLDSLHRVQRGAGG